MTLSITAVFKICLSLAPLIRPHWMRQTTHSELPLLLLALSPPPRVPAARFSSALCHRQTHRRHGQRVQGAGHTHNQASPMASGL